MVKQEREEIERMRANEKIAKRAPALDRFLHFDEVNMLQILLTYLQICFCQLFLAQIITETKYI
jgi:hypothetical protein